MTNKKNIFIASFILITLLLSSCTNQDTGTTTNTSVNSNNTQLDSSVNGTSTTSSTITEESSELSLEKKELELKTSSSSIEKIVFNGDSISYSGDNAFVSGTKLTITKAGNYEITGTLNNGQIVVETDDKETVQIILNGVSLLNSSTSPIYVANSKQTIINLASGATNTISDGKDYVFDGDTDEPNATIFSKDDLVINGEGKLVVNANYNDGIASKDKLYIESGNITIASVDDGIRGKDYLQIDGGAINITASGDALKADNEEEGQIYINGGDITISTGDDGVHAEAYLEVNGGTINITKSYEGLESKTITINGGDINIVSIDDGLNVAGGNDGSGMGGPGGGRDFGGMMGESSSEYILTINGGNININASGDGLDSNGLVVMTGGNVLVAGPTSSGNGFLDYDISFNISGGNLIAYGSSGMLQNVSTTSSQYGVAIGFDATQSSGIEFSVKDSSGNEIFSTTFIKNTQAIVVSSPDLENGGTYTYYLNGEEVGSFTISSITTSVGNVKSGGMGGGPAGGGRPGMR